MISFPWDPGRPPLRGLLWCTSQAGHLLLDRNGAPTPLEYQRPGRVDLKAIVTRTVPTRHVSRAALLVILTVVLAVGFDVASLRDLAQADEVLYFPPQVRAAIILSTRLGGVAYLMVGRPPH